MLPIALALPVLFQDARPRIPHRAVPAAARLGPEAFAEEPPGDGAEDAEPVGWRERTSLLGDLLFGPGSLVPLGFGLQGTYVHDVQRVLSGGADCGTGQSGFLDVNLSVDGERVFGLPGATFFADAYAISGDGVSQYSGDLQGPSNIESDRDEILAELWWEQWALGDTLRWKLGKIDANSEFAYVENGGEFLNSSMGVSPTVLGLPTYPDPSYSAMLEVLATETLALKLGVFDGAGQTGLATGRHGPKTFYGNPSDLFVVAQADTTWGDGVRPGRLGVGFWQHTGEFARFDGDTDEHARGTYLVLDQDLGPLRDRGALGGYLQLGFADGDVSEVESHLGLGLVWSEFLAGRDDAVGVGLTHVSLSSEAEFDEDSELTVELFWRTAPAGWLLLKPDLQYVMHPGGDGSLDDAWILGLRAEFSLF